MYRGLSVSHVRRLNIELTAFTLVNLLPAGASSDIS